MDFDADRIYYSHQNLHQQPGGNNNASSSGGGANAAASVSFEDEEERAVDSNALRRHYREFLSEQLSYPLSFCCAIFTFTAYDVAH